VTLREAIRFLAWDKIKKKWPFNERPLYCIQDVVQLFSAPCPALRTRAGRKLERRDRARRATRKGGPLLSYVTSASSLIEQLEIVRRQRMTARACPHSPGIARKPP
jgi:hypothetical protein